MPERHRNVPTKLTQHLSISQLRAPNTFHVFADICAHSRAANAQRQMGGVLLFDGFRFCQLMTGEESEVTLLAERIRLDVRHEGYVTLAHEPLDSGPHSMNWLAGFCEAGDLNDLRQRRGQDALAQFRKILPRADLFP
jgi:hypothetical protein